MPGRAQRLDRNGFLRADHLLEESVHFVKGDRPLIGLEQSLMQLAAGSLQRLLETNDQAGQAAIGARAQRHWRQFLVSEEEFCVLLVSSSGIDHSYDQPDRQRGFQAHGVVDQFTFAGHGQ